MLQQLKNCYAQILYILQATATTMVTLGYMIEKNLLLILHSNFIIEKMKNLIFTPNLSMQDSA